MKILWDEPKRQANLAKHGFDFGALTIDFFEAARIELTRDQRFMAIGRLEEVAVIAVIFRPLGAEAISIISMRRASTAERSRL
ncbi:BrnT family toxin [Rhizobium sp. SG2393]|uniref:BrnT family toxin n=1 Tax=Rhizobium sp. SG2393 TaxID=3276279 RepID=UPI0036723FB9